MEKSKLGISLNLFSALIYFIGAIANGLVPILIAVGYILIFEKNEKLKRTSVKAFILAVFFSVLTSLINWLSSASGNFFSMLAAISRSNNYITIDNINDSTKFNIADLFQMIAYIMSNISFFVYICVALIMIMLGFRIYKQIDIKIKWIDKILDKHFF